MANNIANTVPYNAEILRRENTKQLLLEVKDALEERGYNAVDQISGYLISNDPAYITGNRNARSRIQTVERYELIAELVRYYLAAK